MLTLKQFIKESKEGFTNHPLDKMKPESKSGMDWEYDREYLTYSKPSFPNAFKSREHFQKEYDNAPMRHLTPHESKNLGNSNLSHVYSHRGDKESKTKLVRNIIGKRRDVDSIWNNIHNGKTTPPIILKHENGLHLMAGNTRLICGAAHNINIPAKIIDVRKKK